MRVNRSTLIAQLEAVRFGVSAKNMVEQSTCVVFKGDKVFSFNDETACWGPSCLSLPTPVAVVAAPLLAALPKLPDDELEVIQKESGLLFRGKGKDFEVLGELEIRLPIDEVPIPTKWSPMPSEVLEGLPLVIDCASRNDADYIWSMVHLTDKFVEASDNAQVARWRAKCPPFARPLLVRAETLKSVIHIEPSEVSVLDQWVFFRQGTDGPMVGCRVYHEDKYQDMSSVVEGDGDFHTAILPKSLGDAADRAYVFSQENADQDDVTVKLEPGFAMIVGQGATGKYREKRKVKYDGPAVEFQIPAKLLTKITKEFAECLISATMIRVKSGRLTYAVSLVKE